MENENIENIIKDIIQSVWEEITNVYKVHAYTTRKFIYYRVASRLRAEIGLSTSAPTPWECATTPEPFLEYYDLFEPDYFDTDGPKEPENKEGFEALKNQHLATLSTQTPGLTCSEPKKSCITSTIKFDDE